MNKGLVENLSMADYRADSAYSSSDLITMSKSMARWEWEKAHPRKKTRALDIGSAFHTRVQSEIMGEKEFFSKNVVIWNEGSSLTKAFKAAAAERPTMIFVDEEEFELVCRMTRAILNEPEAMHYLHGAIAEASFFVTDPEFGIRRKCRPDYLHVAQKVSINLKSAADISEAGFIRSIKDYGLDFQSQNYMDILRLQYDRSFDEIHILVDKPDEGPCRVAIYTIGDDAMEQARYQMREVFQKIVECEKVGKWEDPKAQLKTVDVPLWARTIVGA